MVSLISNEYRAVVSFFFFIFGNVNISAMYVQNPPRKMDSGHEFARDGGEYINTLYTNEIIRLYLIQNI